MAGVAQDLAMIAAVAGRTCVGLVFVLAAAQKMRHWAILPGVIANYRLLPRWAVGPVSALLPPAELVVGALLLSGLGQSWAIAAAIGLLALFAAAMAINLRRGRAHIDCGCGQSFLKQTLSRTLVLRNAVLVLLLLASFAPAAMPMAAALTGLCAGAAFFLLYLLANTLAALPVADHSHAAHSHAA